MSGLCASPVAALAALLAVVPAAERTGRETFTATVVPEGSPLPRTWEGASALTPMQITLAVETWSPPQDIQAIKAALEEGGEAAVARLLRGARAGTLVPPAYVSWGVGSGREPTWRIALASIKETPEGRIALLVTDRPLEVFDTSTVTLKRPDTPLRFGAIRLELDKSGRGGGRLFPHARIRFLDNGGLELEEAPAGAVSYSLIDVKLWTP